MATTKVRNRQTGDLIFADYMQNSRHNWRYWIDGKQLSDKEFDKKYYVSRSDDMHKDNFLMVASSKNNIVFLENDGNLHDDGKYVANFLKDNDISFKICAEIHYSNDGIARAKKAIDESDMVIFQTTWMREESRELEKYAFGLKDKKSFVEIGGKDPRYYYKPKGIIHDIFHLRCDRMDNTIIFRTITSKPTWEYTNDFDR